MQQLLLRVPLSDGGVSQEVERDEVVDAIIDLYLPAGVPIPQAVKEGRCGVAPHPEYLST